MGIKFRYYWNHGSPFLFVYFACFAEASAAQEMFSQHYGCKAGSIQKSVLRFAGHAAVEFLKFHSQPLGAYKSWVPKNDSRKYWRLPDSAFVEEAQKHRVRDAWKRKANGHYQHVTKHRRHLLEACTAHMEREGDPFGKGYQVYAYEFSDHTVYVGLTCTPKRRHKDHQLKGPVARKLRAGTAHELKVIASSLMPTPAGKLEDETIKAYMANGWIAINRKDGGSTGHVRTRYTYDRLLGLARPLQTRKQFNLAHNGAYQYACNHDLIDKIAADLGWPEHAGHVWTKELCFDEAKKFKWLSDWVKGSPESYSSAWRQGWLTGIKSQLFTKKPQYRFWTKEKCLEQAKSFLCRADWQYLSGNGSYASARRNGWLNEISEQVFGKRLHRWSRARTHPVFRA